MLTNVALQGGGGNRLLRGTYLDIVQQMLAFGNETSHTASRHSEYNDE